MGLPPSVYPLHARGLGLCACTWGLNGSCDRNEQSGTMKTDLTGSSGQAGPLKQQFQECPDARGELCFLITYVWV